MRQLSIRQPQGYPHEQTIESCLHNAVIARQQVERVRRHLATLEPGPERRDCLDELSRYLSDVAHWDDYAKYYQKLAAKEGPHVIPSLSPMPASPEREPGADDEDEEAHKAR